MPLVQTKLLDKSIELGSGVVPRRSNLGVLRVGGWWPNAITNSFAVLAFSQGTQLSMTKTKIGKKVTRSMFVSHEANLLQSSSKLRLHLHQLKLVLIIAIHQQEHIENRPIELQVVKTSSGQGGSTSGDGQGHLGNVLAGIHLGCLLLDFVRHLGELAHRIALNNLHQHHPQNVEGWIIGETLFDLKTQSIVKTIYQSQRAARLLAQSYKAYLVACTGAASLTTSVVKQVWWVMMFTMVVGSAGSGR